MKQTILSISFLLSAVLCFAQPKLPAKAPHKLDSAKDKDTSLVKVYFFKTSVDQMRSLQGLFDSYNAKFLTAEGKTDAWQNFLTLFTVDSIYIPKK